MRQTKYRTVRLKVCRAGGAQASEMHANFIINTGDARAADMAPLILDVGHEAARRTGVLLVPTVRRIDGGIQ